MKTVHFEDAEAEELQELLLRKLDDLDKNSERYVLLRRAREKLNHSSRIAERWDVMRRGIRERVRIFKDSARGMLPGGAKTTQLAIADEYQKVLDTMKTYEDVWP